MSREGSPTLSVRDTCVGGEADAIVFCEPAFVSGRASESMWSVIKDPSYLTGFNTAGQFWVGARVRVTITIF